MAIKNIIFFILFSIPQSSIAQIIKEISDSATHFTTWQSLQRSTICNPLNTFYRFRYENGEYKLELKISVGDMQFVVAKNTQLEIITETGSEIALYNEQYERTSKGCGSIA